jgi:hypothetical protein
LTIYSAGIEKPLIRRFMHHSSIESQEIYTQASIRDARIALEAAALRLQGDRAELLSQFGPFV